MNTRKALIKVESLDGLTKEWVDVLYESGPPHVYRRPLPYGFSRDDDGSLMTLRGSTRDYKLDSEQWVPEEARRYCGYDCVLRYRECRT